MKYYTGIGSRNITNKISEEMTKIAQILNKKGYILRSGGADGSDISFEKGAGNNKEIYLPWKGFNNNKSNLYNITYQALELASTIHKNWKYLKPPVRKLMARNCYQVLGEDLQTPSEFIICWTKDGCETDNKRTQKTGGTGQAISLASKNNIRVYNLYNEKSKKELIDLLKEGLEK